MLTNLRMNSWQSLLNGEASTLRCWVILFSDLNTYQPTTYGKMNLGTLLGLLLPAMCLGWSVSLDFDSALQSDSHWQESRNTSRFFKVPSPHSGLSVLGWRSEAEWGPRQNISCCLFGDYSTNYSCFTLCDLLAEMQARGKQAGGEHGAPCSKWKGGRDKGIQVPPIRKRLIGTKKFWILMDLGGRSLVLPRTWIFDQRHMNVLSLRYILED